MEDLKDAIAYIFDHVKKSQDPKETAFISPTGRIYTKDHLFELDDDPIIKPIESHTLASLCDYVKESADELDPHTTIQIVSPTEIVVFSPPRALDAQRNVYFRATALVPQFSYDRYYDQETFALKLRSCFSKQGDVEKLIFAASNICQVNDAEFSDDGISQQASIRTGVVSKERAVLPSSPVLHPFRTFSEVDQPGSPFIFRVKNGETEKSGPMMKLEEADGGAWRLDAMNNIKEFLSLYFEMNSVKEALDKAGVRVTILA